MNLSIGDKIYVTDELLEGRLISFTESHVTFECPDGFEYTFSKEKVHKLTNSGEVESKPNSTIPGSSTRKKSKTVDFGPNVQLKFNLKKTVVDIHLEVLVPLSASTYDDSEALQLQLQVVQELIREANRQRIRKFIVVHGVGKGKLRKEIRRMLRNSYPDIEYLDGNYQKFGAGATELIIHQFD